MKKMKKSERNLITNYYQIAHARSSAGIEPAVFVLLARIAAQLHQLDALRCNGDIDDDTWARNECELMRRLKRLSPKIYAYHHPDPDGVSLYISAIPIEQKTYSNNVPVFLNF